jgi:SAM-dependent methyltransferase
MCRVKRSHEYPASGQYHEAELRIACDVANPHRILPVLPPGPLNVLDIGCGAGQALMVAADRPDVRAFGIDLDAAALAAGRPRLCGVRFACARGERLPFASASFDVVLCRVSLPYMRPGPAVAEMARVLRPGGDLWLVLHSLGYTCAEWRRAIASGRWRHATSRLAVLVNGAAVNLSGGRWSPPFGRWRGEWFQTPGGMRSLLTRAGFEQIRVEHSPHFVVTARKAGHRAGPETSPASGH